MNNCVRGQDFSYRGWDLHFFFNHETKWTGITQKRFEEEPKPRGFFAEGCWCRQKAIEHLQALINLHLHAFPHHETYTLEQFQAIEKLEDLVQVFNLHFELDCPPYPILEVQKLLFQDKGLWLEFSGQRSGYFWCLTLIKDTRYIMLKSGRICKLTELEGFKWIEG